MNKTGTYIETRKDILSIYVTSDYPSKGDTTKTILALQSAGVDIIEVGIPFSDPLADGPVIQDSSMKSLENGFTLDGLFEDLESINEQISIPLVPMGYFNTVLAYGIERFLDRCHSLAIDTVILPDLPVDYYQSHYQSLFKEKGVCPVFLITPRSTEERIRKIDVLSEAFIYVVADNSITGAKKGMSDGQLEYFERINAMSLNSPTIIGFGISDQQTFETACRHANGAIIGSAFIRAVTKEGELKDKVESFIKSVKK
jgi:tryptophan synthase alpha chain